MSKLAKVLKKFLSNPSSIKYPELEKVLIHLGFTLIPAKGSHKKFKHQLIRSDIIIPVHNNDCKKFYKENAAKIIVMHNLI